MRCPCRRPARCSSGSSAPASGRPPTRPADPGRTIRGSPGGYRPPGDLRAAGMLSDDHSGVHLPHTEESPVRQVWRRVVIASVVLVLTVLIVYLDRDGYRDNGGGEISVLDATYYATVTLSTTGYGDITPVTPGARLVNIL